MKPILLFVTLAFVAVQVPFVHGQEEDRINQVVPPMIVLTRKDDIHTYNLKEGISVAEVITNSGVVQQMYLDKGVKTFHHNHPEEETLVVITGQIKAMTADGDHILDAGDIISIESYAEHQLEAIEESYIVQSFSAGRVIVKPDF